MRPLLALLLSSSLLACAAEESEPALEPTPAPRPQAPESEPALPPPLDLSRLEPPEEGSGTVHAERPRDGAWELRWPNGQLALTGTLRDGRRHGSFTFYTRGGSVLETGRYRDGHPVGEWSSHHTNGSVVRTTLTSGYCTTRSVLRGAPRDPRWCGNAVASGAADPRLTAEASTLRRCIDHSRGWLRGHLESAERAGAATRLVMSSVSPVAMQVLRDVAAEALDEIESGSTHDRGVTGLTELGRAGDVELRRRALAVYERSPTDSRASRAVRGALDSIAYDDAAFAERYFAATLRLAPDDELSVGRLLHVGRILSRHEEAERRVALWRGIDDHRRRLRARAGGRADNTDGWVAVELSRACRDTARRQHALEQMQRAIEIFESTECTRCLEETRRELVALTVRS